MHVHPPVDVHVPLKFSLFSCCLTPNEAKAHEARAGRLSLAEHLPSKTSILVTSAPTMMHQNSVSPRVEPGKQKQL